jgi:hypothetical protein
MDVKPCAGSMAPLSELLGSLTFSSREWKDDGRDGGDDDEEDEEEEEEEEEQHDFGKVRGADPAAIHGGILFSGILFIGDSGAVVISVLNASAWK